MADIALGQSIAGSFTSSDPKDTKNRYYDEYDFTGLDAFRQITINLQRPAGSTGSTELDLINAATGAIIAERITGGATSNSIVETTYPGINYKLRVSNSDLGDYTLSSVSGDKATSIVSSNPSELYNTKTPYSVGTIGAGGTYFPLASSGFGLSDVALASNGQFYGVRPPNGLSSRNLLIRIDPSLESGIQANYVNGGTLPSASTIKDASGNPLDGTIAALEFAADNKLYAIQDTTTGDKLYTIDPTNQVATLVGNLPTGFVSQADLVYDAANSRFLAISQDTATSDALWQIPLANPSGATKIGQIGFAGITGLNFENGQLTGFNDKPVNVSGANKIAINTTSGVGTIAQSLSGVNFISGSTTIPTTSTTLTSITDFKKDPTKYMGSIRDYDGNKLGGDSSWKLLGDVDIQGDGDLESILVNPAIGRFASVGSVNGNVDFSKYGLNGDTRVVGIYIDPTLKNSPQNIGGPFDSQRRFQNDMQKDNLKLLAAGDYNKDGFQDLYFKLGDGTAVLRALMFKDGNIQYANYQSKSDLTAFMTANNVDSAVWGSWI